VIREAGGDRSGVTGGTRVISDRIVVKIVAAPGETFLDRMIALVEGAVRQKTPNEIALTLALSALTLAFVIVVIPLWPMAWNAEQYMATYAGITGPMKSLGTTFRRWLRYWYVSFPPRSARCSLLSASPGWIAHSRPYPH